MDSKTGWFNQADLTRGHCLMAILGEDPQPPRLAKCDPEEGCVPRLEKHGKTWKFHRKYDDLMET
jgi:hypothetical protein